MENDCKPFIPGSPFPKTIEEMEQFFWDYFPHEISWKEVHEINPDLYCRLQNVGQVLVLHGKLESIYLK